MSQAPRDDNTIPALLAVSNADGVTPVVVYADPSTHRILAHVTGASGATAASTATVTSVSDTASSTTLLSLNTSRLGATIYNDSTVDLYVKLGTTASTSSFTIKLSPNDYYE